MTVPTKIKLQKNNLQEIIKQDIIIDAIINLDDTTINSILYSTIRQIITDTTYPKRVAIEAPSIPKTGIKQ